MHLALLVEDETQAMELLQDFFGRLVLLDASLSVEEYLYQSAT